MTKSRARGHSRRARTPGVWTDNRGHKRTEGVMGDLEHANVLLEGRLMPLLDHSLPDLNRLADTLRQYALLRTLVDLKERIARLEKLAKQQPAARRARKAA